MDKMYTTNNDNFLSEQELKIIANTIAKECENEIDKLFEDLEKAINAYIGHAPEVDEGSSVYGKRQAFKAGANWLLNKLINKAINTIVVNDWTYGKDPDKARIPAIHERINGYDIGDKIKVIILKNE